MRKKSLSAEIASVKEGVSTSGVRSLNAETACNRVLPTGSKMWHKMSSSSAREAGYGRDRPPGRQGTGVKHSFRHHDYRNPQAVLIVHLRPSCDPPLHRQTGSHIVRGTPSTGLAGGKGPFGYQNSPMFYGQ